jgi:hypothetical protein
VSERPVRRFGWAPPTLLRVSLFAPGHACAAALYNPHRTGRLTTLAPDLSPSQSDPPVRGTRGGRRTTPARLGRAIPEE